MYKRNITLSSPIREKIDWAEEYCQRFRDHLLKDKSIVELLNRLTNAINASRSEMRGTGIDGICRKCEQEEGGSCCGAGLENRYGWDLLLINLLMGVNLPKKRHDPESCFFLDETGCVLQARHVICINYVCKKITDRIDPQKLHKLREKEGEELNTLFLLHERIKKVRGSDLHTSQNRSTPLLHP